MLGRLWKLLPVRTLQGYEHPELVETVFQKTLAYEPTQPWPEMDGIRSVLDFGGACGRHYMEARLHSPAIRWAIVETPAMVARARELETDHLRFFTTIDAAADWLGEIDIIHSNGAIQYTPNPIEVVRNLCKLHASQMLWFRILFGNGARETQISRLSDNGPGKIKTALKKVSYEQTALLEKEFIAAHIGYATKERGSDWFKFAR